MTPQNISTARAAGPKGSHVNAPLGATSGLQPARLPAQATSVSPAVIPGTFLILLLSFLLGFDALSMFFHLIRVSVYDQIGNIAKVYTGVALAFTVIILPFYGFRRSLMSWLFMLLLLHGVALMFANEHDQWRPIVGHFYYWLIMFLAFTVGYSAQIERERLEMLFYRFANIIFTTSAVGFVAIELYRLRTGASLYMGYAGSQLLFPLGVYFVRKNWKAVAATLIILLLTGRRGPLGAGVITMFFLYSCQQLRGYWRGGLLTALPTLLAGWCLLVGARYILDDAYRLDESPLVRLAVKWERTFDFQENLTLATSGRDVEIEAAGQLYSGSPIEYCLGLGFGWYLDLYGKQQHFLHFTYANFLITHGAILGTILILSLLRQTMLCQQAAQYPTEYKNLLWILFFFIISSLIVSTTVSLLSISFLFWMILGITSQLSHRVLAIQRSTLPHPGYNF